MKLNPKPTINSWYASGVNSVQNVYFRRPLSCEKTLHCATFIVIRFRF